MAKKKAQAEATIDRAALKARWLDKVKVGVGRGNGHGACWGWVGAQSKTRNGQRGVIRVGESNMSALRVGIALAEKQPLSSARIRTGRFAHRGKVSVKGECVNPAHYADDERTKEDRRAQGKS